LNPDRQTVDTDEFRSADSGLQGCPASQIRGSGAIRGFLGFHQRKREVDIAQ